MSRHGAVRRGHLVTVLVAAAVASAIAVGATGAVAAGGAHGGPAQATGTVAASVGPNGADAAPARDPGWTQVDADAVEMIVSLADNGSATWRVEYWVRLEDDNDTAAFEDLAADVRADPGNYTATFAERMRSTVRAAENATDREMTASGFDVSAATESIPQDYGVITYTFRWSNFAAKDGVRLQVGDAIQGLYLDAESKLTVRWPAGYVAATAAPDPDDSRETAVIWDGAETDFVGGEPTLVLEPAGGGTGTEPPAGTTVPGTDGTRTDPPGGASGPPDGGDGVSPGLLAGVLFVGLVAAAGVAGYLRRRHGRLPLPSTGGDDDGPPTSDTPGAGDAPDGDGPGEASDAEDDGPPPELLSNEERVLELLEERGGRIKQQEVVRTLGWTDAKTSQVVGDMREEGTVEVFRLGRENVLSLPEEDGP